MKKTMLTSLCLLVLGLVGTMPTEGQAFGRRGGGHGGHGDGCVDHAPPECGYI